jgi:VanZ family protein
MPWPAAPLIPHLRGERRRGKENEAHQEPGHDGECKRRRDAGEARAVTVLRMYVRVARIALAVYLLTIYATLGVVRIVTNFLRDAGILRITVVLAFAITGTLLIALLLRNPRNRSRRTLLALLLTAAAYAVVIVPMKSPEEKIHFIEYGCVAALAHASSPRSWSRRTRFIACALFVAAAGWIDEGIQGLLPTRYYDLRDVAFNAAAGLLALTAIAIFLPRERTFQPGLGTDRLEEVARDADHRGSRRDGS